MNVRKLEKSEWQGFCDHLSRILTGARTEIRVQSLTLGDQVEAEWLPLLGMVYDAKDDMIEIAMEGLDHMIRHPREISVEEGSNGIISVRVIDGDGRQQIAMFREPLMLPGP
ncbi:hypothetical protein AA309_03695 [Microvirga vignae]|uniref:Uncharacterized protein n=1 Tax=Microvirga vignae TaxID=1225564 RepID=A0A0H1RGM8_9HYPH|nr:DUF5335 domain-containing protein [Microvirga vignae]KLK94350.1 hypothetical protein AA309_03695 [Microvirga vignae]